MKNRYFNPPKPVFSLTLTIALCWALAGNALDQWDAKSSARVNLRRVPDLRGEILRILPLGHKVQILEQQDLWCRVAIEGELDVQGWVHGQYLQKMAPEALKTEPLAEPVKVETAPGESIPKLNPVEPPSTSVSEPETVQPPGVLLPEQNLTADVTVRSPVQAELQKTENESNAQQFLEFLLAAEPVHVAPVPSSGNDLKKDAPVLRANDFSAPLEPAETTPSQKRIPGTKKDSGREDRETRPALTRQQLPEAQGMALAAMPLSDFQEANAPESGRRPIGPLEIALKLVSIFLYGFAALLLYKGRNHEKNLCRPGT